MSPDANTATPAQEPAAGTIPKPPVARREPVEYVLHGDRRVDHYAWLRHKEKPEVMAYLQAENSYTDATLKPTETTGFRQFTLEMKDLRTGTIFPERVERVTSVAWASDNRTLFYTVEDETTKRSHRLYRHVLGATEPDPLLFEEIDERFRIEIERTRSGAFLLLTIASHTTSEVRYLRADQPSGEFRLIG